MKVRKLPFMRHPGQSRLKMMHQLGLYGEAHGQVPEYIMSPSTYAVEHGVSVLDWRLLQVATREAFVESQSVIHPKKGILN